MATQSLRERKKQKTHERLIEIATRLFLEKGFENTTIDEIVKEAELSQRTFFRYFPTKESIVFREHDERERQMRKSIEKHSHLASPFEAFKLGLMEMGDDFMENRTDMMREYTIVMSSRMLTALDVEQDLKFQRILGEYLHHWNGKVFLPRPKAYIVAGAIFGTIRAVMEEWFESDLELDLETMGGYLYQVVDVLQASFQPE